MLASRVVGQVLHSKCMVVFEFVEDKEIFMKRYISILIFSILIVCFFVGFAVVSRWGEIESSENTIQNPLDGTFTPDSTNTQKDTTSERENFFSWYKPRILKASPEVQALIKKFDASHKRTRGDRNLELEQMYPTDEWLQMLLDMGITIDDFSDYSYYTVYKMAIYSRSKRPRISSCPSRAEWA